MNPTRMELTRLKKRLATAVRAINCSKDKLDELMKNFFDLVEENRNLRHRVEENLDTALGGMAMARAVISRSVLEAAIITSRGEAALQATTTSRMGVEVPLFQLEMTPALGNGFGMTETSAEFDEAIDLLANSFQSMIELAQVEKTVELMAAEMNGPAAG